MNVVGMKVTMRMEWGMKDGYVLSRGRYAHGVGIEGVKGDHRG